MRVLLDTNALIFAVLSSSTLRGEVISLLVDPSTEVLVSAASAWEIATKVRLGKLPEAKLLESSFTDILAQAGYQELPVTVADALHAGRLPGEHRDPLDRMIAAQAVRLDIPVISADRQLDSFGVRRIW